MSELAKKARAAMKAKAERLGASRPIERVSSSDWTPPEPLNADVKTGMRPVSRRAFKKGGKVMGEACAARADRKPRKAGGKAEYKEEATEFAKAKINRDVKAANEEREGVKHVGGMKTGGRAKKESGGAMDRLLNNTQRSPDYTPRRDPNYRAPQQSEEDRRALDELFEEAAEGRKRGGRTKKQMGGDLSQMGPGVAGAAKMMRGSGRAGVPGAMMQFSRLGRGALSPARALGAGAMKKGGEAKHPDEAMDKALIKKMVKSEARTGKKTGGTSGHSDEAMDRALIKKMVKPEARKGRATGGEVFSGSGYPNKVPGVVPGGREARATGGKAGKAKTNINIVIAAGKPAGGPDMMPPPGAVPTDNRGAGGIPVPVSTPPGGPGGMPGGAMPIPMPIPMPMAGGPPAPAGGMPMGRKTGGRVTKVASSYKDMQAGAGSGEGRLQKTDIAKKGKGAPAYKAGGKVYRSYKDMDAGAGSGRGRLEKTEIESRKH